MKARYTLAAVLLLAASMTAWAATLGGTVTNATTGKPAAGDDVALLSLSQGMQESARAKTDAQGKFAFSFESDGTPHLVRVTHAGVNYFPQSGPVGPNVSTVDITVYDVAKNLPVATTVNVTRLQSDSGALQVMQLMAVKNDSTPPRTLNSDRGYAFTLPEGAQIDEAVAQAPNGMPVSSMPVPDDKQKGTYYFVFPLRPGETRFQLAYHLPYSGEFTFTPKLFSDMQHFVVMMPKSMTFEAKNPSAFSSMNDPQGGDARVEVSTQAKAGSGLQFSRQRHGPAERRSLNKLRPRVDKLECRAEQHPIIGPVGAWDVRLIRPIHCRSIVGSFLVRWGWSLPVAGIWRFHDRRACLRARPT